MARHPRTLAAALLLAAACTPLPPQGTAGSPPPASVAANAADADSAVLPGVPLPAAVATPAPAPAATSPTASPTPSSTPSPSRVPAAPATPGAVRWRVDPAHSELRLRVGRDGPLARLGHDHVIAGPVEGEIRLAPQAAGSSFTLSVPVALLRVDEPGARAEEGAGFESEVPDAAREGTRRNLLSAAVLDAERHPALSVQAVGAEGPAWNPTVTARVTLRGVTRDLRFPAAVMQSGDALQVVARFALRPSEFGIAPFSVLGGALRVADRVEVRVRLAAQRAAE